MKSMKKASKMQKPGKAVSGKKYAKALEKYDEKVGMEDNYPARKPADIADALSRSAKKKGYSKKPTVKSNRVGKGK